MSDRPIVVGINRTQDGSVAVATPAGVHSLQKERITRRKHHWGRLGDLPRYAERLSQLRHPVDLVVECFSSDDEIRNLTDYERELAELLTFTGGPPRVVRISHHLSYLFSAFPPSPYENAAVMVIDAQGSRVRDLTEPWPGDAAPDLLECASWYLCERGRVECLDKQLWNGDWATPAGLGCFYYLLTRMIFPDGEGNEGKVMGLAPYGRPDPLGLPPLTVQGPHVLIPDEWTRLVASSGDRFGYGKTSFQDSADLAAAGRQAFEEAVLRVADWLHRETGASSLCFAGGTALNCSANGRLMREGAYDRVFIPPSPHDGGTAVGCALYGLTEVLGAGSEFRWTNDFLGPDPDAQAVYEAVAAVPPDLVVEKPADLAGRMVDLLDSGRVVGLHHGRSESGPRALGNRSILGDARRPGMQDFVNSRVKGREWFRPLAPLVLAEVAEKVFDVDRPAPFMQFAADVRPEFRSWLPSITHVDGTARLRTVEESETPFLYGLLRAFEARTGCPVLLNTPLNGQGQPLVETPAESLDCLLTTDMHALALPPYLVRKRVEPDLAG